MIKLVVALIQHNQIASLPSRYRQAQNIVAFFMLVYNTIMSIFMQAT